MAFDPHSWANKLELIIDSSKVDEDLTDFPILITLSSGTGITNFDATDVFDELITVSGTKKIAITTTISGVETECYTEIERWDWENEQAWLWTKVPTVTSGIDTDLYLYYDSTHDDNTGYIGDTGDAAAQNVWDNNFKSTWHMAQDPSGGDNCILGSTANAHTGTPIGSMTSDDLVDGKIGKAIDFDGSNDGINFGDSDDFTFSGDFTIEWIMNTADTGGVALINNTGNANTGGIWELEINRTANKFTLYEGGGTRFTSSASVNDGTKHMYLVRKSGTLTLYINSAYDNEASYSTTLNGTHMYLAISYASTVPFDGIIDEFRMSNNARSVAWGKASYYSNWNDIITFSASPTVIFIFTNPIPTHLSTVYGTSHTLQLTVTCSGEESSYIYDGKFYDASDDSQIGSTVSGTNSGQSISTTMQTPNGTNYSWYLWVTSSGESDRSSTYIFTNKFKCAGTVTEGETALSGIPVRLYKRDTGELIGSAVSTGVSGTFEIVTDYNEYHYAIALYASTVSGVDITETNALIYDHLKP